MFPFSATPSPVYGIAFVVSFLCWFAFELWVFSRDRGKAMQDPRHGGRWLFLAFVAVITLAFNLPALAPGFDIQNHLPAYFILGIVLIWGGLLFRYWAIRTLGRLFSTNLVIQERHRLITEGPYKYLRNPSYTAGMITFVGFGFAVGNWLSVAALLLMGLLIYALRIPAEERVLSQAFGQEFEDYKTRTWALIPFIW